MSFRLDVAFLRVAILYAIFGMILGIYMAASKDHTLTPAHTHIQLMGWVSMALFALIYRTWPEMARLSLARWHFWLANIGALVLNIAVTGIYAVSADRFEPMAQIGSLVTLAGMIVFLFVAFKGVAK